MKPMRTPLLAVLALTLGCSPQQRGSKDGPGRGDAGAKPADAGVASRPDATIGVSPVTTWPTSEPCRMGARPSWDLRVKHLLAIPRTAPSPMPGIDRAEQIAADQGWNHCAVLGDRALSCWGSEVAGTLGDDPKNALPHRLDKPGDVVEVALGGFHFCARRADATVWCWGASTTGQLGPNAGSHEDWGTPVQIPGLGDPRQLAAGLGFTCARLGDGTVWCWGQNTSGQLGDGSRQARPAPRPVSGLRDGAFIAAGPAQVCAATRDGAAWCWGDLVATQCAETQATPTRVPGVSGAIEIAVGAGHACVLGNDGIARCWGANDAGQIGDGTVDHRFTPVPVVDLSGVAHIAAGASHTCALASDGTLRCWGANQLGQVDGGATKESRHRQPVVIGGLGSVTGMALSEMSTCVRRSDGSLWCWGITTAPQVDRVLGASPSGK